MVQKEFTPIQLSQFNSAAQGISRSHEIKLKCIEYRRKGNLTAWNFELDNLWLEICSDKNLKKVNSEAIEQFFGFWSRYADVIRTKIDHISKRARIYKVLFEKEQWLRILEDRLGKGSRYQKEDDSGM